MSPTGAYVPPAPPTEVPVNSVVPSITGLAQSGQKLTASTGVWAQSPDGYAYQWKANGTNIPGATARTFNVTDTQIGTTLTVTVTATNSFGSAAASSAATVAVKAKPITAKPVNTVTPAITGSALVGSTLMVSDGTWQNSPSSYSYQWFRNGTALSGATANIFALMAEDYGTTFSATVTATNVIGSTTASTNNVGPISQNAPVNMVAPAITGTAQMGETLTGSNGTWSNSPTGFTYVWTRDGIAIDGATSNTLALTAIDVGSLIGFKVTATNLGGSTTAEADEVGPVVSGEIPLKINIVAEGDSISNGYMSPDPETMAYPQVAVSNLPAGPNYVLDNIATAGIRAEDIDTPSFWPGRGGASFDPEADLNIYTILAGANDKNDSFTDKQIYRNLRSILQKAKVQGYDRRLIGTLIATDEGSPPDHQWGGNVELNQLIRTYWNSDLDADGLFDFGADTRFDTVADASNYTYYNEDDIHLTQTGYAALAEIYEPVLEGAIDGPGTRSALPATWFPLDTSPSFQLSNGNRTVNWPGMAGWSNANVRGAIGKDSGKWYWELKSELVAWNAFGICNLEYTSNIAADDADPTTSPNAIGYSAWSGAIKHNDVDYLWLANIVDGDVISFALDMDNGRFWMRVNDGLWNGATAEGVPAHDPAANTGGIDVSVLGPGKIYPVGFIYDGGQITSRFGAGETTGTIPTGFTVLGG
ncbi:hypothetical protein AS026_19475 [Rhizobium altiplani]|uniref:B30.2/SPRY domain-containing protein n=1 Tax=Rhizobium altiplani TaxID=1864509 RepID=A0A109J7Q5_9HYPH|nr:GDSL-type esterase/lipase family protein [Rhizobium altiplani]KWV43853.1 hypothetical protein AS026_19475 [Rhizobium altiplani]